MEPKAIQTLYNFQHTAFPLPFDSLVFLPNPPNRFIPHHHTTLFRYQLSKKFLKFLSLGRETHPFTGSRTRRPGCALLGPQRTVSPRRSAVGSRMRRDKHFPCDVQTAPPPFCPLAAGTLDNVRPPFCRLSGCSNHQNPAQRRHLATQGEFPQT